MKKHLFFGSFLIIAFLATCSLTTLAATITVTSPEDSGVGSLRTAISSSTAGDTIQFNISNSITVFSYLQLPHPLHIEGSGQTIGAYTTSSVPLFYLTAAATGTTINGLALVDAQYGIYGDGADHLRLYNCRIGTDYADTSGRGHSTYGIALNNSTSHAISSNILSGNGGVGVGYGLYFNNVTNSNVYDNIIGLDSNGTSALPNGSAGIALNGSSSGNLLGMPGLGNVISGNGSIGLVISGQNATGNSLCGNVIGLSRTQIIAVPNGDRGVWLNNTTGNWVGTPESAGGNVIAGHSSGYGIYVASDSNSNIIQNNRIGLSSSDAAHPNQTGISIMAGENNLIGGNLADTSYVQNIISGNSSMDLYLGNDAISNSVCGNIIGLDSSATNAVSSGGNGISIYGSHNLIGGVHDGSASQFGNYISGHASGYGNGISLAGGDGNTIAGNVIGLNSNTNSRPNYYGININTNATNTLIGGTIPGAGNVISANSRDAIRIYANAGPTSGHRIQGNHIGTDRAGTTTIPNNNGFPAISLYEAINCTIGGNNLNEGNIITGHNYGVMFSDTVTGSVITGNWFGMHSDLSNSTTPPQTGIIGYSSGMTIGTQGTGQGNLIANAVTGIALNSTSATGVGIFGNTICAFSTTGINIESFGANNNKSRPSISAANTLFVSGTADAGDSVELFLAEPIISGEGGSLAYLDTVIADGSGNWSVSSPTVLVGQYVCATATDSSNNTSPFSVNAAVQPPPSPTYTPTATTTATVTPTYTSTATITLTPTPTATSTQSATVTATPSVTQTYTTSPTPSVTPSITQTATITPTVTPSPSSTVTPSLGSVDINGKIVMPYPNPASSEVNFLLHLAASADVVLSIYNVTGEQVAQLAVSLPQGQGQIIPWNCSNAAPGIYFVQVIVNGAEKEIQKIAIVK